MKQKFYIRLLVSFISVILLPLIAFSTWAETAPSDTASSQAQIQSVLPDDLHWSSNSKFEM